MTNLSCTAFLAEHIQNLKIAVIGDVMLDRYFYGEVKRCLLYTSDAADD